MCCGKTKCERPKDLKGKAEACLPEQIRKCHGNVKEHPCATGRNEFGTTGQCKGKDGHL